MLQKVQVWTSKSTLTYLEVWGHFQLSGWCVTSPFLMAVNLWKRVLNQSSLIILSGNRFQICIKTLISVTAFDYQYKGHFRKKYEREKWYNSFHTLSILKKRSSYKHKKITNLVHAFGTECNTFQAWSTLAKALSTFIFCKLSTDDTLARCYCNVKG